LQQRSQPTEQRKIFLSLFSNKSLTTTGNNATTDSCSIYATQLIKISTQVADASVIQYQWNECWLVVTKALHILIASVVTTSSIVLSSSNIQTADIVVPAYPGPPGEMAIKNDLRGHCKVIPEQNTQLQLLLAYKNRF